MIYRSTAKHDGTAARLRPCASRVTFDEEFLVVYRWYLPVDAVGVCSSAGFLQPSGNVLFSFTLPCSTKLIDHKKHDLVNIDNHFAAVFLNGVRCFHYVITSET